MLVKNMKILDQGQKTIYLMTEQAAWAACFHSFSLTHDYIWDNVESLQLMLYKQCIWTSHKEPEFSTP
jgi:hypothetical protein